MVVTETTVMGGGGSNEITMNPDEMHTIMRYIANIEISFQNNLAPKLKSLSETKYYEGEKPQKQWTTMLICLIK